MAWGTLYCTLNMLLPVSNVFDPAFILQNDFTWYSFAINLLSQLGLISFSVRKA